MVGMPRPLSLSCEWVDIYIWYKLYCSSKGSRRPISLTRTRTQYHARSEYHTQLACRDEFRQNIRSRSWSVFLFLLYTSYIYIYSHTATFQLLDKPWSQVSSLLPPAPGSCVPFLSRIGFSTPAARRFFIECC